MNGFVTRLVASIPSPSGNSFSLGPLNLNAYGLMIALGVLAGVWLTGTRLESKRWGTADDASSIGMWGVAFGVIGARLYHVATDFDRFRGNLGDIPKIWEGGLGIPGGLLLGTAAGLWASRRRGISAGRTMTAAAPAIPLAQAIGRWGNWFNQELFGRPTDLPWGLEIDDAHTPAQFASDTTFHPTFLYESLWNLGLVALLLFVDRRFRLAPGRLFAVYVFGYGLGRYWIEGLRIDSVQLDDVAGLRWNQWVALACIVGGAGYLVATRGRRDGDPDHGDLDHGDLGPDRVDLGHADSVDDGDVLADQPVLDGGAVELQTTEDSTDTAGTTDTTDETADRD
ncbi:MAG: prolipoprotein diacylglyceryl transferase [Ilumatobacter sp.]